MYTPRRNRPQIVVLLVALAMLAAAAGDALAGDPDKRKKKAQKRAEKIAATSYTPGTEWEGYFKDDKGFTKELLEPLELNADKDWLGLLFTDYTGPTISISVMKVENKTAAAEQVVHAVNETDAAGPAVIVGTGGLAEVPVGSIEELLTTSLFNTHRFELVERKAVGAVLAEQDFGEGGRVAVPTAAGVGQIQGAKYLIFASVNEWTPTKSKVGGGGGFFKKVGGIVAGGKSTAEVAMSFRVVDATTSKVLFAINEKATAGNWNIGLGALGGGALGGGSMQKNSPVNYAVVACINKGVYQLATWMKDRGWSGAVMKVKTDGKVYINAGRDSGLQPQTKLTVLSKGEELVDPTTGRVLGFETEAIGSLVVTSVTDAYSVAAVLEGCEEIKIGDEVQLYSDDN